MRERLIRLTNKRQNLTATSGCVVLVNSYAPVRHFENASSVYCINESKFLEGTPSTVYDISFDCTNDNYIKTKQLSDEMATAIPSTFVIVSGLNKIIENLLDQYSAEKNQISGFVGIADKGINNKVIEAIKKVASIDMDQIKLELRDEDSLIFTLNFIKIKIFIRYYPNDPSNDYEASFSFYNDKTCLSNGVGNIDAVIKDVKLHLRNEGKIDENLLSEITGRSKNLQLADVSK